MSTRQRSNRTLQTERRQEKLKDLILRLHEGEDPEAIKVEFQKYFSNVSAFEISVMERRLMAKEGIEAEDIMRLCNIHASMFIGNVAAPENISPEMEKQGHPVQVLKMENLAIESTLERIERLLELYVTEPEDFLLDGLYKQLTILSEFDTHYLRKENSIFPLMEKYDIVAPPKVMWGVDDDIRDMFKSFKLLLNKDDREPLLDAFAALKYELEEMVVKEEEIMIPMVMDIFNEDDWIKIAEETEDIGYCIVKPEAKWEPDRETFEDTSISENGNLPFETGHLTLKELEKMLNLLPLEITFVDKNDTVKYFNTNEERKVFPRTKNAIGRQVLNCHPPKSQPVVKQLISDFREGKKESESLWFKVKGKFIMVTYAAVRDEDGSYLGTLEYVQDIGPIVDLDDEKKVIEPAQ